MNAFARTLALGVAGTGGAQAQAARQLVMVNWGGIANQAFRGNEFGVHEVCAVLLAKCTKRRVADVFHGCQKQWKITEFDIAYFNHMCC